MPTAGELIWICRWPVNVNQFGSHCVVHPLFKKPDKFPSQLEGKLFFPLHESGVLFREDIIDMWDVAYATMWTIKWRRMFVKKMQKKLFI
jgi:hypothetical protein